MGDAVAGGEALDQPCAVLMQPAREGRGNTDAQLSFNPPVILNAFQDPDLHESGLGLLRGGC